MSKKMSKILMLAVALVLAVSMICMVACSGGTPLKGEEAMETLQDDFKNSNAEVKTVTEDIKIGGIKISIKGVVDIGINNVDIKLLREYKNKALNLNAVVQNIDVSVSGGMSDVIMKLLPGGIDATAIANVSKIKLEVSLTIDKSRVKLNNLTVYGLDQLKNNSGQQLDFLKDGNDNPLGSTYTPSEIQLDKTWDDLLAGLAYAENSGETLPATVKSFILNNYDMISLFDFGTVTVNKSGNKITSNADAKLDRAFGIAQDIVDGYVNNEITEDGKVLGDDVLKPLFGTTNVESAIGQIIDLGKVNMSMNLKYSKDDEAWKINNMEITDTMTVTITGTMIKKVLDNLLPAFGLDLDSLLSGLGIPSNLVTSVINSVVGDGLSTNINISVKSSFSY